MNLARIVPSVVFPSTLAAMASAVALSLSVPASGLAVSASAAQFAVNTPALSVALCRLELTPEHLASVGATQLQVVELAGAVQSFLATQSPSISDHDQLVGQARVECDVVRHKIQEGRASPGEIAGFSGLEQALAAASTARDAAVSALFVAGIAEFSATQRATLTAIRANAHWKLPTEFLVVERTEAEWVALRNALANERTAARNEETPNQQCQALLGTARANPAVAAAKTALDANLAVVKQSWDTVTGD